MSAAMEQVPGFLFFDHVAVSVKAGELEPQVRPTRRWASRRCIAKTCWAGDQVREVLLQVGDGPNLVQLLEPLDAGIAGGEADGKERRPRRSGACGVPRGRHPARRSTT